MTHAFNVCSPLLQLHQAGVVLGSCLLKFKCFIFRPTWEPEAHLQNNIVLAEYIYQNGLVSADFMFIIFVPFGYCVPYILNANAIY